MAIACLALLLAAASAGAGAPPDEEAPLSISGFRLERLRKTVKGSNVVYATFDVRAADGCDLGDLRATIRYTDSKGTAVARVGPSRIGDVAPGRKTRVKIKGNWVPAFQAYVVTVTGNLNGNRGEWKFFGTAGAVEPVYMPDTPVSGMAQLVVMGHELQERGRGGTLHLRVKNIGAEQARDAHCVIKLATKRRKASSVRAKLSGAAGGRDGIVDGGEERLFRIRFRSIPSHTGYSVKLEHKSPPAEERFSGGEFTDAREVELARFKFTREDGNLVITGAARNGTAKPVENVEIVIRLKGPAGKGGKQKVVTAKTVLRGRLEPGGVREFRLVAKGVKEFSDFEQEVAYEEPGATPAAGPPARAGMAEVVVDNAARKPDGRVVIEGSVTNRGETAIKNIVIVFSLNKKEEGEEKTVHSVTHRVPGVLEPGATSPFELTVENAPPFDHYVHEITYGPAGKK